MKDFEKDLYEYLYERGWDKLRPGDIAKSINIEAGEILELFQWTNKSLEEVKEDEDLMKKIYHELPDTMLYCFEMAILLGIDTEQMLRDKMDKVREKYSTEIFNRETVGEEPGSEEAYWKVKGESRGATIE